MKGLFTIIFYFITIFSFGQIDVDYLNNGEPGKCYLLLRKHSDTIQPIDTTYMELVSHEFELYSFKVGNGYSPPNQYEFQVSPPTQKLVKRKVHRQEYYEEHYQEARVLCMVEVPARYVDIPPVQVIKDGDTLWTVPTQKVMGRRMITPSEARIISKEEAQQTQHEVWTLAGKWEVTEYIVHCGLSTKFKIMDIQKALNEKGYNTPLDGILDKATRKALIQFQKDNNLKEGRLDINTLKALGVYE